MHATGSAETTQCCTQQARQALKRGGRDQLLQVCYISWQRPKTQTSHARIEGAWDIIKRADDSAYGILRSVFAGVRPRLCCAQNALNMFVSYHLTPSLFIDFAISFAINHRVSWTLSEGFWALFGLLLSRTFRAAGATSFGVKRWRRT